MRPRFVPAPPAVRGGTTAAFGDFSFLMLAFFLVAGNLSALGGSVHSALPKALSGGC